MIAGARCPAMTNYRLRDGLSYGRCGSRAVFLDLLADRYFCLTGRVEMDFERWARDDASVPEKSRLDHLIAAGLIVPDIEGRGIARPADMRPAIADLLVEDFPTPSALEVAKVLSGQVRAGLLLRCRPLATILAHLASDAAACQASLDSEVAISRGRAIAAAFAASGLLLHTADRCLPRGLAAMFLCQRHDVRAELVFGVRLNPFLAHCWVQLGDRVLVGDFEQARLYTPVLVVR